VSTDQGTFDKSTETAGGNDIHEDSGENLRTEWDAIPRRLGESADATMMATARAVPPSSGPMENSPAAWASETVLASHRAFRGLSFTPTAEACF
jgi:hypothetical protein